MRTSTDVAHPMLPFHFGEQDEALFGCHHAPVEAAPRDHAIVLCYPAGQEYIRAHRSFVVLARRLARRGFHVLRFDYFGTGDSAGDVEEGGLSRWVDDTCAAVAEARRRSGAARISLVGLRLGGTIAALATAADAAVDDIVLWDPVVDGGAYLEELRALQSDVLRYEYVTIEDWQAAAADEVLGFPLPPRLRAQLASIDLTAVRVNAADVLLIETAGGTGLGRLHAALASHTGVEYRRIAAPRVWLTETYDGIVPLPVVDAVIGWLERERS